MSDNASSMKPSTTFTVLSQPPDFGIFLSMVGKRANTVNGMARAIAKPVIPTTGPITLPRLAASTKRVPIIGPVQENDTITSVAAMKKMLSIPVVLLAVLSILLLNDWGSVISNAPKNEMAKITSNAKNSKLHHALVASAFMALAPNSTVKQMPRSKNMMMIDNP